MLSGQSSLLRGAPRRGQLRHFGNLIAPDVDVSPKAFAVVAAASGALFKPSLNDWEPVAKAVGNPYGFTFVRRNSLCSWFLDRRCSCIDGRCVGQPYDFTHDDPGPGCDEHEIIL